MKQIARNLKKFLFKKIYHQFWVKIASILFIVISILVVFLGLLLINNSQRVAKNSVLTSHRQIVSRVAEEISLSLKRSEDVLNNTAVILGAINLGPWQQETVLVGLVLEHPMFLRATLIDLSGKQVATSDLGRLLDDNYVKEALAKTEKEERYVSAVRFLENNHVPYLTMAVPVKIRGRMEKVLVADINLRGLWKIVDAISLGRTGGVFLVSNDGTLIASPDKKQVLKNKNLIEQKDVFAVLSGKNEAVEFRDGSGKKWISSYAPISGVRWGVVLRQEQNEAYLFSRIMNIESWIIIILSEILVIFIAIFLARTFVKPITALLLKLKRTPDSNLESERDVKRHDEIGELVKVFNDMASKLKKAKVSERFSDVGEVAVWVAHELKNSLVPIKSFIQLFPTKHHDEKFIGKFRAIVPEEISRFERMLKEFSDFSAYSELKLERLDIRGIIDNVLKMMEVKFIEKKVQVRVYSNSVDCVIQGDNQRLKQVFINLILNALNAMPDGGMITINILLNGGEGVSFGEIRISDTGLGIPEENLKILFEPFKNPRKEGMGLGLAICRKIIEQHKGDISVKSRPGQGTTFTIRLPVQEPLVIKSI